MVRLVWATSAAALIVERVLGAVANRLKDAEVDPRLAHLVVEQEFDFCKR